MPKDKNIIPKDKVQSMLETIKKTRTEVCDVAEKFMGHIEGEECPNEGCPLHGLCNALLTVEVKLDIMEHRPLEGKAE